MGKMKATNCPECNNRVARHDANRVSVKVAAGSNGQGVYKEYHMSCYQKAGSRVSKNKLAQKGGL